MNKLKTYARLLALTGLLAVSLSGAAFAALQSQQSTLKGNTIQTATANLQLSSDGTTYMSSLNGYSFNNLVPGGSATPAAGFGLYIKNMGSTNLNVKLAISKPITNPDNVDLSKVHVILVPTAGGSQINLTLQDLITNAAGGGMSLPNATRVLPNQSIGYVMQVSMESDAVNGSSASLSDIDFSFSATAVN